MNENTFDRSDMNDSKNTRITHHGIVNSRELRCRRQGLHSEHGQSKTITAAALASLVCLALHTGPVTGSSRNIPPSRRHFSSSAFRRRSRFLSSNRNPTIYGNNRGQPTLSQQPQPILPSSQLHFSKVPEEENEFQRATTPNSTISSAFLEEEDEDDTHVTTTSFFRLPAEDLPFQEPQTLTKANPIQPQRTLKRILKRPLTSQEIQNTFVYTLMAISGFVEGFCIRTHGCFPNLMTGSILKLAEALGSLEWSVARFYASMIGAYTLGGSIFGWWKGSSKHAGTKETTLQGVSFLSGAAFLASDLLHHWKLPLLATGFGILNAGTLDAGAGVTNAMTGHVTKIGQGLVAGGSNNQAHHTSAKGLVVFSTAALVANLLCGLLERGNAGGLLWKMTTKIPMGTTLVISYATLLRWYAKASMAKKEEK